MKNYKIGTAETIKDFFYDSQIRALLDEEKLGEVYRHYLTACVEDLNGFLAELGLDHREYLSLNDLTRIAEAVRKALWSPGKPQV